MVINSSKGSSATIISDGKAKLRLETALTRLEEILEEKVAASKNSLVLAKELDTAKQEIVDLENKNRSIAVRLDLAIDKMKMILSDQ